MKYKMEGRKYVLGEEKENQKMKEKKVMKIEEGKWKVKKNEWLQV